MANTTVVTAEPGKQELFITREFDAPRELVFRAHTDPGIYVKWIGPYGMTMTIEKWEMRDGGSYKYTHERGGHTYAFFGVNHEALEPERIIGTFELTACPSAATLSWARLCLRNCRETEPASCINQFSFRSRIAME